MIKFGKHHNFSKKYCNFAELSHTHNFHNLKIYSYIILIFNHEKNLFFFSYFVMLHCSVKRQGSWLAR